MDRKLIFLAVMSVALVFLAVTAATARPWTLPNTPLYTFRMEQASNEMNFSPAKGNGFAYAGEGGHTLGYDIAGLKIYYSDAELLATGCKPTCVETCLETCVSTCPQTCVNTCSTCVSTCPHTCVNTCSTCVSTCSYSCVNTCWSTCAYTCDLTCDEP